MYFNPASRSLAEEKQDQKRSLTKRGNWKAETGRAFGAAETRAGGNLGNFICEPSRGLRQRAACILPAGKEAPNPCVSQAPALTLPRRSCPISGCMGHAWHKETGGSLENLMAEVLWLFRIIGQDDLKTSNFFLLGIASKKES